MKKSELFFFKGITLFLLVGFLFFSCSESYENLLAEKDDNVTVTKASPQGFTMADLEAIATKISEQGYDISAEINKIKAKNPPTKTVSALVVASKKIEVVIPSPADSSKNITISGMLLYPRAHFLYQNKMSLIVATPGTYFSKNGAPSIAYEDMWAMNELNESHITTTPYIINAASNPVLLVDYPGFGSSDGQIAHPYLDQKVLATTSITLIRKTQDVLKQMNFRMETQGIYVTGYSQGAFAAASIVREIETNPDNRDLEVKLLSVGGLPAKLMDVLDMAVEQNMADQPILFFNAIWGYKLVRYPNIPVEKIIKEPYYSLSYEHFTGGKEFWDFPFQLDKSYSEEFLTSYRTNKEFKPFVDALEENSLKPWKNKAHFYILHSTGDITVPYNQVNIFAREHTNAGGKVEFTSVPYLNHAMAFLPAWIAFNVQFAQTY